MTVWRRRNAICALGTAGIALLWTAHVPNAEEDGRMNTDSIHRMMAVLRDTDAELSDRVRAAKAAGSTGEPALIGHLQEILQRDRAELGLAAINWDPAAAERVVHLHIIAALHRLGDDSRLDLIARLVAQAEDVLQGPDDEIQNAVMVARDIGRIKVLSAIVDLAGSGQPPAAANAVRVLQGLELESAPTGGPLKAHPDLTAPRSFRISRLREEIETIAALSNGRITLSQGTHEFITQKDFERGDVARRDMSLAEILQTQLDLLDLAYYHTENGIVICTLPEAGEIWHSVWRDFSKSLDSSWR